MTTKRFTMFAIVMAAFVLLVGCKKEKTENVAFTPQASVSGMLHFNSAEEFLETQQMVLAMSETERREWERQQGFKSYATKCYELLEELEAKGINSDQDIYDFVNENSEYFYIYEENGEKYLQNRLENSVYKYYANEDQMLQMGNNVIKTFEKGIVSGTMDQLDIIMSIDSFENANNDELSYIPLVRDNVYSNENSNAVVGNRDIEDSIWRDAKTKTNWSYISQRIKTGLFANANRNVTKVYYESYIAGSYNIGEATIYYNHWRIIGSIRPWHRIAGIWYPSQRTKTYNIQTRWQYDGMPSSDGYGHSSNYDGVGGYEKVFLNRDYSTQLIDFEFTSFSGWSFTPDTPRIDFPLASETD